MIGIDTAASLGNRFRSGPGVGFAIPIADAMAVVRQIESGQATDTVHIGPTAFLGVSLVSRSGSGAVVAGRRVGLARPTPPGSRRATPSRRPAVRRWTRPRRSPT